MDSQKVSKIKREILQSPDFLDLLQSSLEKLENKTFSARSVRESIRKLIADREESLSSEEREQLFSTIYSELMKRTFEKFTSSSSARSRRKVGSSGGTERKELFPKEELERRELFPKEELERENFQSRSLGTRLSSQSLRRYSSSSANFFAFANFQRYSFSRELAISPSEGGGSARFEIINDKGGFYLIDRIDGKIWFVSNETRQVSLLLSPSIGKNGSNTSSSTGERWDRFPRELSLSGETAVGPSEGATLVDIDYSGNSDVPGANYHNHTATIEDDLPNPIALKGDKKLAKTPHHELSPSFRERNYDDSSYRGERRGFLEESDFEKILPLEFLHSEKADSRDTYHSISLEQRNVSDSFRADKKLLYYPLSYLNTKLSQELDPRQKLSILLRAFDIVLKFMAAPLVNFFSSSVGEASFPLENAYYRLTNGRWSNIYEFIKLFSEQWENFEPNPIIKSIVSSFKNLEVHKKNSLKEILPQLLSIRANDNEYFDEIGPIEAFIAYRESFVGEFSPFVEEAEDALKNYEPLFYYILEELDWLNRYWLFFNREVRVNSEHLLQPLMGSAPLSVPTHSFYAPASFAPYALILGDPENLEVSLPLYPFFILAQPPYENESIYPKVPGTNWSFFTWYNSTGQHFTYKSLEDGKFLSREPAFFLYQAQERRLFPPLNDSTPTADEILERTQRWTLLKLSELSQSLQWFAEITIPREEAENIIYDFIASDYLLFTLTGSRGVGKTSLLASLAHQLLSELTPVVYLSGLELLKNPLPNIILEILGGKADFNPIEALSKYLKNSPSDRKLIVIIDQLEAVEYSLEDQLNSLDSLLLALSQSELRDKIKFIISLNNEYFYYYWYERRFFPKSQHLLMQFEDQLFYREDPLPAYELPPFSEEELETAFNIYKNYRDQNDISPFAVYNSWDELYQYPELLKFLRHPLLLRIALTGYCEGELPPDLSVKSLFQFFQDTIIEEKNSYVPIPERISFLRQLTKAFLLKRRSHLTRDELLDIKTSSIIRAIDNIHFDSPYTQLLNFGILSETWYKDSAFITFSSSLFFSYFLTKEWLEDEWGKEELSKDMTFIFSISQKKYSSRFIANNFYLFLWPKLMERSQLPVFSSWLIENFLQLTYLFENFLLFYIQTDGQDWYLLVNELLVGAEEPLYQSLFSIISRLWRSDYREQAQNLLELLLGAAPPSSKIEAEILYRKGRLHELSGELPSAQQLYLQAKEKLTDEPEPDLLAQIYLRLSNISRIEKRLDEAKNWLYLAEEQLLDSDPSKLGRVYRHLGNISHLEGDFKNALLYYKKSLDVEEKNGQLRELAVTLGNLGTVLGAKGELEEALSFYRRCLHLHQSLGDRKLVSTIYYNIGIIYKRQNNLELARDYFSRSLQLRIQLRLYYETVDCYRHLAWIAEQQGQIGEALENLQNALKIQHELRDIPSEISSHLKIGHLYKRWGHYDKSAEYYQAACDLSRESGSPINEAKALYYLANLAWEQNNPDEALKLYLTAEELLSPLNEPLLLSALSRSKAIIYMERREFQEAEEALAFALSKAEEANKNEEIFECMLEWAQFYLLQNLPDRAEEYLQKAADLFQKMNTTRQKDLLCLQLRIAIKRESPEEIDQILSDLKAIIKSLSYDNSPLRTVWALLEAATYYRDKAPFEALNLARTALNHLANRPFSRRRELEQLCAQIAASPKTPLASSSIHTPIHKTDLSNEE